MKALSGRHTARLIGVQPFFTCASEVAFSNLAAPLARTEVH